ncbi:uncharacterized protein LOC108873262 isoform X2 [Lates japonicus]
MDVADKLVDKIFSWVKLQRKCADKLRKLATELEERKRNVNGTKIVGSTVSVGGAAALTAAGALAFFTGGLAIPVLAATGAVASGVGLATSVGSDIADVVISNCAINEAKQISKEIEHLEKELQRLMGSLKEEQQAGDHSEDHVMERILRAMAKRNGLKLPDNISLYKMMFGSSKMFSGDNLAHLGLTLLLNFVKNAAVKEASTLVGYLIAKKLATNMGEKAAKKAAGRIAGGAVALAFSVRELINNCEDLNKCETEISQSLRENASDIRTAAEELEKALDEIQCLVQKLARIKHCIENTQGRPYERRELIEFAIENCQDEATQQWLRQNSECAAFLHLVDMFNLVKQHIEEEQQKDHSNNIDITFVAHGSITEHMIPASCLLPLATIKDVVLYSPWNCTITANAAYGIATGRIQPHHRVFYCGKTNLCHVPHQRHHPTRLPYYWNQMRRAGAQFIPNIMVGPVKPPSDRAWNDFLLLTDTYGQPGRNHIVIPFTFPGASASSVTVPFVAVTLALSLALWLSRFQATIHLAACLGKTSEGTMILEDYLKEQYACTINYTAMTTSADMLVDRNTELYRVMRAVFG